MKYFYTLSLLCLTFIVAQLPSAEGLSLDPPNFEKIPYAHAKDYIKRIYTLSLEVEHKTNVPHPIVMAIACLESKYGSSYIARKNKNHFGLRNRRHSSGYCHFDSYDASFAYFSRLMQRKRYKHIQGIKSMALEDWVHAIQTAGYNPHDRYTRYILQVIRKLKLHEIKPNNGYHLGHPQIAQCP